MTAHALAGRNDHVHSDEDQGVWAAYEEAWVVHRANLLLADRLNDRDRFHDLLSGIDATEIEPHLHRALMNLDRAIQGEIAGEAAVFSALSLIQRRCRLEAEAVWRDECRAEAERQLEAES